MSVWGFAINTTMCFCVGQRSNDPLSPAYIPSTFSFTTPQRKRELEQGLERFQAAKRRRENKENIEACDTLQEVSITDEHRQEPLVYPPNTVCMVSRQI